MMRLIARCALATLLFAIPAAAQDLDPLHPETGHEPVPVIQVSGSGTVLAAPDEAQVRLGVLAQRPSAREAQDEANRIAAAILSGVAELGVPAEQVQTSELQLFPVYTDRDPRRLEEDGEPRIVAYRANYVVTVRVEDLEKVGPVIDSGLDAGANQLQGVSFSLSDDEPVQGEALARAVAEARGKAETMARALGVGLGPVLDAVEGGTVTPMPHFAAARFESADARESQATPVSAGQIRVSARVTLRYRIEQ